MFHVPIQFTSDLPEWNPPAYNWAPEDERPLPPRDLSWTPEDQRLRSLDLATRREHPDYKRWKLADFRWHKLRGRAARLASLPPAEKALFLLEERLSAQMSPDRQWSRAEIEAQSVNAAKRARALGVPEERIRELLDPFPTESPNASESTNSPPPEKGGSPTP